MDSLCKLSQALAETDKRAVSAELGGASERQAYLNSMVQLVELLRAWAEFELEKGSADPLV